MVLTHAMTDNSRNHFFTFGAAGSNNNNAFIDFERTTAGASSNGIGLGFYGADGLLRVSKDETLVKNPLTVTGKITAPNLYPVGSLYTWASSSNPQATLGGAWDLDSFRGDSAFNVNNYLRIEARVNDKELFVTAYCANNTGGNLNYTYDISSWFDGVLTVSQTANGVLIPMPINYVGWNVPSQVQSTITNYRIMYAITNQLIQSFTIDSNVGSTSKNDYMISFMMSVTSPAALLAKRTWSNVRTSWQKTGN
jgi:hypothetical protein